MKRILFALSAIAVITLAACKGGGNAATPEAAVKGFMAKMQVMDIEGAKKYATKESAAVLDMMKMGLEMAKKMGGDKSKNEFEKMKDAKVEYGAPKIDGDNATIAVTTTMDGDADTKDIKLKKEDGSWKVAFDKSSLMDGENKGADAPTMEDLKDLKGEIDSLTDKVDMKKLQENVDAMKGMMDSLKK
jgi:Domain of unknown function (DUF4878)